MADEAPKLTITDPDNVPVTFVTHVLGQGALNGVINMTLGVARFTPTSEGDVSSDMIIVSRLRLDITAAEQMRAALDQLLKRLLPQVNSTGSMANN